MTSNQASRGKRAIAFSSPRHPIPRSNAFCGLVAVLGLALFLYAVLSLGQFTRQQIRDWDRFVAAFGDIDCTPPESLERGEFLAEVQYLADLPEHLPILDEGLTARLAEGFAKHPNVERVEHAEILPGGKIFVRLSYRVPVLEVRLLGRESERPIAGQLSVPAAALATDGTVWLVDARGNVLPRRERNPPLPVLKSRSRPAGPAGRPWGDAGVEAAARTAGFLHLHREKLRLTRFLSTANGLVLSTAAGSRVLWGRAPGSERTGEAPAALKLERLLDYCRSYSNLDGPAGPHEHNVQWQAD